MLQPWADEKRRLIVVILVALIAGWVTGHWAISILVASGGYITWQLIQFKKLIVWLKRGANLKRVPDLSGAWAAVIRHVYIIQRRNRKRKNQLRSLLLRFEQVSVALPDGAIVLKPNNEIDWANKVAAKLLGIHYPKDVGQRIDNLLRNPEFRDYLQSENHDEALNIPSPVLNNVELSILIIPFGKNERLLTARDISTFSRVQAMRRDFVANVSHELRTPLTVIAGYLEALIDDEELEPEMITALKSIQQQSNRMRHIVKDLLELSRLESDMGGLSESEVHVPSICAVLLTEFLHMAEASEHKLFAEIDENLSLHGGEKEFTSLVTNLVHNALRHTPAGTEVRMRWFQDPLTKAAIFQVTDTGPGIELEHIPRLTERFYRIDNGRARAAGGSGLGLSIVKHIMLRHSGQLKIDSELGAGSSFICIFPTHRSVLLPMPKRVPVAEHSGHAS